MDHEHRHGEVTQDFPGRHLRVLGHAGAPVYRAVGAVDDRLALSLNRWATRSAGLSRWVGAAAQFLAGCEVLLMVLLALSGRRRSALEMLGNVGLVYLACEVLGRMWPRRRPFERFSEIQLLAPHSEGRSFPSRHVASGLVMAAIAGEEHPRLGTLMTVVAWALGLSRVMGGLHYPSDVLAGAGLAAATIKALRTHR
jgi:membrane-associated phospholipid phosphatase